MLDYSELFKKIANLGQGNLESSNVRGSTDVNNYLESGVVEDNDPAIQFYRTIGESTDTPIISSRTGAADMARQGATHGLSKSDQQAS